MLCLQGQARSWVSVIKYAFTFLASSAPDPKDDKMMQGMSHINN